MELRHNLSIVNEIAVQNTPTIPSEFDYANPVPGTHFCVEVKVHPGKQNEKERFFLSHEKCCLMVKEPAVL